MYKKIIIIISLFLLVGCTSSNINSMSLKEIVDKGIESKSKLYNINAKGYRYYLPNEFSVKKDDDFVQELISRNTIYYLNVDVVSYYYKNIIHKEHEYDDYEYFTFGDDINGYLKIRKNNDNFFVELCYNYAIIEIEVEENDLKYAISRGITILKSIKYNDLVIDKIINDNDIESSETIYKLPEPKNKDENKNILEYIEVYEGENQ